MKHFYLPLTRTHTHSRLLTPSASGDACDTDDWQSSGAVSENICHAMRRGERGNVRTTNRLDTWSKAALKYVHVCVCVMTSR